MIKRSIHIDSRYKLIILEKMDPLFYLVEFDKKRHVLSLFGKGGLGSGVDLVH